MLKAELTSLEHIGENLKHSDRYKCPACGEDISRVPLVELAYTFAPCDCKAESYTHLIESVWHLDCLGNTIEFGHV